MKAKKKEKTNRETMMIIVDQCLDTEGQLLLDLNGKVAFESYLEQMDTELEREYSRELLKKAQKLGLRGAIPPGYRVVIHSFISPTPSEI